MVTDKHILFIPMLTLSLSILSLHVLSGLAFCKIKRFVQDRIILIICWIKILSLCEASVPYSLTDNKRIISILQVYTSTYYITNLYYKCKFCYYLVPKSITQKGLDGVKESIPQILC
jgi:hypothetical protein